MNNTEIDKKVVCRAAPSPTGFMHIGNLRTIIYNYLFAKKHNGVFYLRIEDTDQKRFVPEAEDYIKRALEWIGTPPDFSPWNEGEHAPYRQSERDYTSHINTLIENGSAYYAFDTDDEINAIKAANPKFSYNYKTRMLLRNSLTLSKDIVDVLLESNIPYVVRFKVPENLTVTFNDIIRGDISINTEQLDDKVLVKSNGIPTYHLANVCDDHDMGTTHVIRGEEWIPSTPLHILLYKAFNWEIPYFAHLPLILNPDGKGKLSKRTALKLGIPVFPFGGKAQDSDGNMVEYKGFKDEGYDADALLNFLVLVGCSFDGKEVMTLLEMIENFSLENVSKSGAKFDIEKAKWFNSVYLRKKTNKELLEIAGVDNSILSYTDSELDEIIVMAKERAAFSKDLKTTTNIFFERPTLNNTTISDVYAPVFKSFLGSDVTWETETIKQKLYESCEANGVKFGKFMPILREVVCDGVSGPDLMSTIKILKKQETFIRIENYLSN